MKIFRAVRVKAFFLPGQRRAEEQEAHLSPSVRTHSSFSQGKLRKGCRRGESCCDLPVGPGRRGWGPARRALALLHPFCSETRSKEQREMYVQGNSCWIVNTWVRADQLLGRGDCRGVSGPQQFKTFEVLRAMQKQCSSCQPGIWGSSLACRLLHNTGGGSGKCLKEERIRKRSRVMRTSNVKAVSDRGIRQGTGQDVNKATNYHSRSQHFGHAGALFPPSLPPPTRFYELYRSRFIVEARKEEKELRCMIYVHFKGPREVTLDVL